jgi:hypothetical protein
MAQPGVPRAPKELLHRRLEANYRLMATSMRTDQRADALLKSPGLRDGPFTNAQKQLATWSGN